MYTILVIAIFAACYGLTSILERRLSANELALARLGLAAICRTILPLGILLLMEYTTTFRISTYAIVILIAYLVSVSVAVGRAVHVNRDR